MTRRGVAAVGAVAALAAALAFAEGGVELPVEHAHPSGTFTFRTPEGWRTVASPYDPDDIELSDGELLVRFLFDRGEAGYDSLHVTCMLERLLPPMKQMPQVEYEYDFQMGRFGALRVLDSAFVVTYDEPVGGHVAWRQRNLTLVGGGVSLCVITYIPAPVHEKSKRKQALIKAIAESVTFVELEERAPEQR